MIRVSLSGGTNWISCYLGGCTEPTHAIVGHQEIPEVARRDLHGTYANLSVLRVKAATWGYAVRKFNRRFS